MVDNAFITRDTKIHINGSLFSRYTQGWSYDALGQTTQTRYPRCIGGTCATNTMPSSLRDQRYNQGQLSSVTGYATSITYHPSGLLSRVTHSNGIVDQWDADPHGMARPSRITAHNVWTSSLASLGSFGTDPGVASTAVMDPHNAPDPVDQFSPALQLRASPTLGQHLYDGTGNVTQRGAETYTYDLVSRLTSFHTDHQQSYQYDAFGNLTRILGYRPRNLFTSRSTNRLNDATYDTAGNITQQGTARYTYDPLNMLTTRDAPRYTYIYTADEERIWTYDWRGSFDTKLETFTLRDLDGRALSEFQVRGTGSMQWTRDSIYRGTHLLAADTAETGARSQKHYSLDHLGSPRLTTGTQGQLLATHHYFGFGEEIAPELHPDPEKHRFTGHERDFSDFDRSYDLDYMHARYCSPQLGRFLSVDPARRSVRPTAPQTWNRYAYAVNSPLKYVDPDGEAAETVLDLAFVGADIKDIYDSVSAGEGVSGQQLLVLGGDLLGVALPGIPGLGRAGKFFFGADKTLDVGKAADRAGDTADAAKAARSAEPSRRQIQKFERQLEKDGVRSLDRSRRKIQRRLTEHRSKLRSIHEEGGFTSSIEKETRNFERELNAIDRVLKGGN